MLSCFINLARIALLANLLTLIVIPSQSTATTFAFIDTPETKHLLLSLQEEEDPDEEGGKTIPPTS